MHLPVPPIENFLELALGASKAVMTIYNDPALADKFTTKHDESPLTLADNVSHNIIVAGLQELTPGIPVLSEEGASIPYEVRKRWEYFWCVDPLDGTKEFLSRNGEFTVNIALIHDQLPVLGIICVPVTQSLYYASQYGGSWKITNGQGLERLRTDKRAQDWTAVGSRSHGSQEEKEIMNNYPITKQISAGSSLKFCLVAEGAAHFYYRHGPTMEWDTAAGHAIVQCSGGEVSTPAAERFLYNKESLLNGPFICKA